jgi:hypothetical protein
MGLCLNHWCLPNTQLMMDRRGYLCQRGWTGILVGILGSSLIGGGNLLSSIALVGSTARLFLLASFTLLFCFYLNTGSMLLF